MFEVNGLIPELEKLIHFRINDLDQYTYQLYAQENLEVSSVKQVELIALKGLEIDLWAWLTELFAEGLLYIGVVRALMDFMHQEGALPKICYFWINLIVVLLLYVCLVLLVVSLVKV